jgi:hypothetical protein
MFQLNPQAPYADVLYTSGIIGDNAPEQLDADHTLTPTLHDFTYTTDFYTSDSAVTQALEFDVSLWISGVAGMTFGTECNHLGDGDWDIWNNPTGQWIDAQVPCAFVDGWNHLSIQFEREANNYTLYKTITLNGTTYTINKDFPPINAPDGWWGVNLNFQMDSNYAGQQVTAYLDNLSLTYQ